jgi:hypothetical protein
MVAAAVPPHLQQQRTPSNSPPPLIALEPADADLQRAVAASLETAGAGGRKFSYFPYFTFRSIASN